MKKQREVGSHMTVAELARVLNCSFEGEGTTEIQGVSSLEKAEVGDLVFLAHRKHRELLDKSKASASLSLKIPIFLS
jgi:UDP-3-O-[3-hydroxymyristoyl] glucosamine N-acyltransferase